MVKFADLGNGWKRYDYEEQALGVETKYFNDTRFDYSAIWRAPWCALPGHFTVYAPYPSATVHQLVFTAKDKRDSRIYYYLDAPGLAPWQPGDGVRMTIPYGASVPPGHGDGTWIGNNWPWVGLALGGAGLAYWYLSKGRR